MTQFDALLDALAGHRVEFIVVGGAAGIAHGAARLTSLQPVPSGSSSRPPVPLGSRGLNSTLTTSLGDIDLLGEITGGGTYAGLRPEASHLEVFGNPCLCPSLPQLIRAKRAAGRPKDLDALAELEAIEEEQSAP